MKKTLLLCATLLATFLVSCGSNPLWEEGVETMVSSKIPVEIVATSPIFQEILTEAQTAMEDSGYDLQILSEGSGDGIYASYVDYALEEWEILGTVHYSPMGIYGAGDLEDLPFATVFALPSNPILFSRGLYFLEREGLISLRGNLEGLASTGDIEANYYEIEMIHHGEADFVLGYEMPPSTTMIAREGKEFGDVLAVMAGEPSQGVVKLLEILQGAEMQQFIAQEYGEILLPL